jgi:NTE family protein
MKWALVLSGGGALGLAHLGVIKILKRENLIPKMIVGTSMGAVIGALWATGRTFEEMQEIALDFSISNYLEGVSYRFPSSKLTKVLQAGEAFGNLLTRRGIDNGIRIRTFLNGLFGEKSFQDTEIPFYCNAVDLLTGHEMIMNDGPLADGIYASMAFPGFFEPLERGEELLCDGSVRNNYPVWIARHFGCRKVLGVDAGNFSRVSSGSIENGISVIFRSFITACQTQKRTWNDKASLTLHLGSSKMSSFDFNDAAQLIKTGEDTAEKWIGRIKRTIYSPAPIRRTIEA